MRSQKWHAISKSKTELAALPKKGPNSADLLQKLLIALGVDAKGLEYEDPLVMRDLQRLCTTCGRAVRFWPKADMGFALHIPLNRTTGIIRKNNEAEVVF